MPLITASSRFARRTVVNLCLMWCKDNVNASDMNTVIHHIGKQSLKIVNLSLKISIICIKVLEAPLVQVVYFSIDIYTPQVQKKSIIANDQEELRPY